jgi:hypothetical protein
MQFIVSVDEGSSMCHPGLMMKTEPRVLLSAGETYNPGQSEKRVGAL